MTIDDEPSQDEVRVSPDDVDTESKSPLVVASKWIDGKVDADSDEVAQLQKSGAKAINLIYDQDLDKTRIYAAFQHGVDCTFEPDNAYHMSPEMREAQTWTIPPQRSDEAED